MKMSNVAMIQLLIVGVFIGAAAGQDQCDRTIFNGQAGTAIPNDAFSASSYVYAEDDDVEFGPDLARVNLNQEDIDHRVWRAGALDTKQYIQVDLGTSFLVRGIITRGCGSATTPGTCNEYVRSYSFKYSMDGETWQSVKDDKKSDKVFNGNSDSTSFATNYFDCSVIARYVKIIPVTWHSHISMEFDLLGCATNKATDHKGIDLGIVLTEPIGGDNLHVKTFRGQLHRVPVEDGQAHEQRRTKHSRSLTIATNKKPLIGTECLGGLGGLSCLGKPDGEYQHCVTCTKFIRCTNAHLAEFICPPNLVWDDNVKDCMMKSTTCQ